MYRASIVSLTLLQCPSINPSESHFCAFILSYSYYNTGHFLVHLLYRESIYLSVNIICNCCNVLQLLLLNHCLVHLSCIHCAFTTFFRVFILSWKHFPFYQYIGHPLCLLLLQRPPMTLVQSLSCAFRVSCTYYNTIVSWKHLSLCQYIVQSLCFYHTGIITWLQSYPINPLNHFLVHLLYPGSVVSINIFRNHWVYTILSCIVSLP